MWMFKITICKYPVDSSRFSICYAGADIWHRSLSIPSYRASSPADSSTSPNCVISLTLVSLLSRSIVPRLYVPPFLLTFFSASLLPPLRSPLSNRHFSQSLILETLSRSFFMLYLGSNIFILLLIVSLVSSYNIKYM